MTTTTHTTTKSPLSKLPTLLAEEPAVRAVVDRVATAAVPEPARALFLAALARVTTRRPLLVAVPTAVEAERVAHDLAQYMEAEDAVELFPAWETLPFERVSPSLETMARRLRVMWRLRAGGDHLPDVVVAPVRALVQRLGPHVEDVEPIRIRTGDQLDRGEGGVFSHFRPGPRF
jgi:transcription-repair coupling factor (superfamily II helicase)